MLLRNGMKYLVRHMDTFDCNEETTNGPKYIKAIYRILPSSYQLHWDFWPEADGQKEWGIFQTFMM